MINWAAKFDIWCQILNLISTARGKGTWWWVIQPKCYIVLFGENWGQSLGKTGASFWPGRSAGAQKQKENWGQYPVQTMVGPLSGRKLWLGEVRNVFPQTGFL